MLLWLAVLAAAAAVAAASPFRLEIAGSLENGRVHARTGSSFLWGLITREGESRWAVKGWRVLPPSLRLAADGAALPAAQDILVTPEDLARLAPWRRGASGAGTGTRALLAVRRWRVRRLRLRVTLGTGEAAPTALCAAAAWAGLTSLAGAAAGRVRFLRPPEIAVAADFSRPTLAAEWECIAEAPLGHVIIAGVLALYDTVSRNLVKGAANPGPATPAN